MLLVLSGAMVLCYAVDRSAAAEDGPEPPVRRPFDSVACASEGSYRSLRGDEPTRLEFSNKRSGPVKVYWIDYDGRRQHYRDLAPGSSYEQQTFMTHPWVVTEARPGQPCIALILPGDPVSRVTIE